MHRPCGSFIPRGRSQHRYVGELGPGVEVNRLVANIGPRISIYTHEGDLLRRLGSLEGVGAGPGRVYSPHGIAVDSRCDIYIGEVSCANWTATHGDEPMPCYL